ncbi:hypothetical protein VPH35_017713 [Triticum aestivum]|uniref:uncharacterized protein n=1 Tax=Triticum aestivum TaxID=4565 RepID=UPI001D0056B1|nr:uncharacterized protein LOC123184128 [Triticum aestivum]
MAGARAGGSFLAVTLVVVVVAASSMPVVKGDDKSACVGEYSKLCGNKDPACTTMVETTCHDDADSVKAIKGMFDELAKVGGDNYDYASTAMSWGHVALGHAVDEHGACPGNKTVGDFAGEHCIPDLDAACKDPSCSDGAYIECGGAASRFCYIKATPADKKAIQQNLKCFKECLAQKKKSEDCILHNNEKCPAA